MSFGFFKSKYGGTHVRCVMGPFSQQELAAMSRNLRDCTIVDGKLYAAHNHHSQYVDFEGVKKLARDYGVPLDGKKFAGMILRLQRYAENWHLSRSGVSTADSVLATKIETVAKLKSVGVIANALPDFEAIAMSESQSEFSNAKRLVAAMQEICDFAGSMLDAKHQEEITLDPGRARELEASGFDIRKVDDYHDLGGSKFLVHWFNSAPTVFAALKAAQKRLQNRNYGKDKIHSMLQEYRAAKNLEPLGEYSAETILYGHDLPKLFERMTGQIFQSSKNIIGDVEPNQGHAFVAQASMVIGLTNVVARTIHDHWKETKQTSA